MPSTTHQAVARDYDAEVAEMLKLATAVTDLDLIPRLVDQSAGIAGMPGISVTATAGDQEDANA